MQRTCPAVTGVLLIRRVSNAFLGFVDEAAGRRDGDVDYVYDADGYELVEFGLDGSVTPVRLLDGADHDADPDDDPDGPDGGGVCAEQSNGADGSPAGDVLATGGVGAEFAGVFAELLAPMGPVSYRMLAHPMPKLFDAANPISSRTAPRALELLTFIALRGSSPIAKVMDAMWPHATDQRTTIAAVSRIRGAIAPATITLVDDRYTLDGIDSDWARFTRLVDTARTVDASGAMVLLRAALELVGCRPFEGRRFFDSKGSSWEWLEHDYLETDVLVRIVDAAEALGELALCAGDPAVVLRCHRLLGALLDARDDVDDPGFPSQLCGTDSLVLRSGRLVPPEADGGVSWGWLVEWWWWGCYFVVVEEFG